MNCTHKPDLYSEASKNFVFEEDKDVTSEAFTAFVSGYLDGSLQPHVKSEVNRCQSVFL